MVDVLDIRQQVVDLIDEPKIIIAYLDPRWLNLDVFPENQIAEDGHSINFIKISGRDCQLYDERNGWQSAGHNIYDPFEVPEDVGSVFGDGCVKIRHRNEHFFIPCRFDLRRTENTVDKLREFLATAFGNYRFQKFSVDELETVNNSTGDTCRWKKRMVVSSTFDKSK